MEEEKESRVFIGKSLRVFVSYSTRDKKIAGAIKQCLEQYGMDVFLAHEDITPSAKWQEEIIRELRQSDVFLPLLTKNFQGSEWTDQETGIAFGDEKFIIPLKVDIDPYGFISRFQALKFEYVIEIDEYENDKYSCIDSSLKIIESIFNNKNLKDNLQDCLIKSFVGSTSYVDAADKAQLLSKLDDFSKDQINEIVRGSIEQTQVHKSWKAHSFLKELISKHDKDIDPVRKKELSELIELYRLKFE
ncbi:MAG: toll/interleukin-1 receptor domain-containing protein [candidate division Zixibacteria bacterium]|nr:toll/interleukin-1 receptor domain-containing protein [candidate division Zixibacteria bacterium]